MSTRGPGRARASDTIRVLHLSDLHFVKGADIDLLRTSAVTAVQGTPIHGLVVSGDCADKCSVEGYDLALRFLQSLSVALGNVPPQCTLLVPGNHDVNEEITKTAFSRVVWSVPEPNDQTSHSLGAEPAHHFPRDESIYRRRFERFSERLYRPLHGRAYPEEEQRQYDVAYCRGVTLIGLNSAVRCDHLHRGDVDVSDGALARALETASQFEGPRVVVWHHPIVTVRGVTDRGVMQQLAAAGIGLGLHGDSHVEDDSARFGVRFFGAATASSASAQLVPGAPRGMNVIEWSTRTGRCTVRRFSANASRGPWKPEPPVVVSPGT